LISTLSCRMNQVLPSTETCAEDIVLNSSSFPAMRAGTNSWKLCQIPFKIYFFVNKNFWTDLNRGSPGPAVPCQAVSAPPAESLSVTHLVRSW
jgi:hypothetical protein